MGAHVANRWQSVLINAHPIHEELLLLIFARDHNRRHSCGEAADKYKDAQRSGIAKRSKRLPSANANVSAMQPQEDDDLPCSSSQKRQKQRKRVHEACNFPEIPSELASCGNSAASSSSAVPLESSLPYIVGMWVLMVSYSNVQI